MCANDGLRRSDRVVAHLARRGVAGVLNAPTTALLTGPVRAAVEKAGLGFDREAELMSLAREHGLRPWGYACTPAQASALARHGAEAVVAHLGITKAGPVTARHVTTLAVIAAAARAARPDVLLLAHGGPLTEPAALRDCGQDGVHFGFFGASVFQQVADLDNAVSAWRHALSPDGER